LAWYSAALRAVSCSSTTFEARTVLPATSRYSCTARKPCRRCARNSRCTGSRAKLPKRIAWPRKWVRRSSSQASACSRFPANNARTACCAGASSHSSASSSSTQGCEAIAIAAFFCAAKPSHSRCSTRAPRPRAMSAVASVDPESSTITSAQSARIEATQRPMRSASFLVMTTPDRGRTGIMRAV
jgi:hypothetical protein